ncbi:hypothetical protein AAF712_013430 [Marasmius tenuissimus]|uniref:Uncharacterized protein n=1 Tax=Marasmius tenuissimus TaxID=585030 RepID=A0ABR2ZFR9_9AGAR
MLEPGKVHWSHEMRHDYQQIVPQLFLGSLHSSRNTDRLTADGITDLIRVLDHRELVLPDGFVPILSDFFPAGSFTKQCLTVDVEEFLGLSSVFKRFDSIVAPVVLGQQLRDKPRNVLVFCTTGMIVAPVLVSMFLVKHFTWDPLFAMDYVSKQRSCVYFTEKTKRAIERFALELKPQLPVDLLMFGMRSKSSILHSAWLGKLMDSQATNKPPSTEAKPAPDLPPELWLYGIRPGISDKDVASLRQCSTRIHDALASEGLEHNVWRSPQVFEDNSVFWLRGMASLPDLERAPLRHKRLPSKPQQITVGNPRDQYPRLGDPNWNLVLMDTLLRSFVNLHTLVLHKVSFPVEQLLRTLTGIPGLKTLSVDDVLTPADNWSASPQLITSSTEVLDLPSITMLTLRGRFRFHEGERSLVVMMVLLALPSVTELHVDWFRPHSSPLSTMK